MENSYTNGNPDMNEVTQDQHTQVLLAIAKVEAAVTVNSNQNVEIIRRLDVTNGSVAKLFARDEQLQKELLEHAAECQAVEDIREIKREVEALNLEQAQKKGEAVQRNRMIKGLQPAIHYIVIAIIVFVLSQGPNILHFFFPHMGGK